MKRIAHKALPLLVLLTVVSCNSKRPAVSKENDLIVAHEIERLQENRILLTELRSGHVSNVLEALEFAVDSSVVILGKKLNSLEGSTKEQALATLRMIRDYRKGDSRHLTQTNNAGGVAAATNDISLEARRLLRDLR